MYNKIKDISNKWWAAKNLGGECERCHEVNIKRNEEDIFKLCFHHKDGDEKLKNISKMMQLNREKIEKELQKCELLCFNCHAEEHYHKKK